MTKKMGVLLTNTGTPDAPTPRAVARYLREFLSDKRIVKLPRLLWLPILYGLVLPFRSKKSAALYRKIWSSTGDSPMRMYMRELAAACKTSLECPVEIGMHYGNPSIASALASLAKQGVNHLIVLPLFPQYSSASTACTYDLVSKHLANWPTIPHMQFISDYHDHPSYIAALAETIKASRQNTLNRHLLISFHGVPTRFIKDGDLYQSQTETTARLLAEALHLTPDAWTLCYQSKFGVDAWLTPSTQDLLTTLPSQGCKDIDIVCPGFSVDCLETLEEIAITGRESFLEAGGNTLKYIPALNVSNAHHQLLCEIIQKY